MSRNQSQTVTLLEIASSRPTSIDAEGGVIRGVKILGRESRNGRSYDPTAVRTAARLYEHKAVNFDHPTKHRPDEERPIADRAGWLEGVHVDTEGGLTGDLHLLTNDPRSSKVLEAAQKRPELFGLSHNAEGREVRRNGTRLVEEIFRVRSVDIVSDPASTKSLFESQEQVMEDVSVAEPVAEPTASPAESVKWGFRDAVNAVLDGDGEKAAKLRNIKELLAAEEKAMAALEGGDKSAAEETPSSETTESLRAKVTKLEAEKDARLLLESKGRQPTAVRVEAVAAMSKGGAEQLIETWPQDIGVAEKPRSTGQLRESANTEMAKTPEDFVAAITE